MLLHHPMIIQRERDGGASQKLHLLPEKHDLPCRKQLLLCEASRFMEFLIVVSKLGLDLQRQERYHCAFNISAR